MSALKIVYAPSKVYEIRNVIGQWSCKMLFDWLKNKEHTGYIHLQTDNISALKIICTEKIIISYNDKIHDHQGDRGKLYPYI